MRINKVKVSPEMTIVSEFEEIEFGQDCATVLAELIAEGFAVEVLDSAGNRCGYRAVELPKA